MDILKVTEMDKQIELSIYEIAGSPFCFASSDGQKVYNRLETALRNERVVVLSFRNITTLTCSFLNVGIGQLYSTFSEEKIRSLLQVKDMNQQDMALLKRVVDSAKLYFNDHKNYDRNENP